MTTKSGEPDDGSVLRAALKKASAKVPVGSSYRWAVNTAPSGDFQLQMQTLPAPASIVEGSPILMGDNAATVIIRAWDLEAVVFDGERVRGPTPVFFTENIPLTRKALGENPDYILSWYSKAMKR